IGAFIVLLILVAWVFMSGRFDGVQSGEEKGRIEKNRNVWLQLDEDAVFGLVSGEKVWNWDLPVGKMADDGPYSLTLQVVVNRKGKVDMLQQLQMTGFGVRSGEE